MDKLFSNTDAEARVIAAMLKPGMAEKHIGKLTSEDFTLESNRKIYAAMQTLHAQKRPIDVSTLDDTLYRQNGKNGIMDDVLRIVGEYSFGAEYSVQENIRIVAEATQRRTFCKALEYAMREAQSPDSDIDDLISRTRTRLREFTPGNTGCIPLHTVLINAYTELEERASGKNLGMPSGLPMLDSRTAGFHKGEMTIIGARPAVGKSALACQIAIGAAENGHKVCICSREMTDIQYGIRILSRGTNVSNVSMRTGKLDPADWCALSDSMNLYGSHDIRFLFSTKNVEDLEAEVRSMKEQDGIDMLIVDYVQLMQSKHRFEKDFQRIGHVSKMLKDMSTELNIAVIALAQVGRSTEGQMPSLSELRGSGDLEQDADNVIFIHRPEHENDEYIRDTDVNLFRSLQNDKRQYLVLNVAKQRQGETGAVVCIFNPTNMTFTETGG